MEYSEFSWERQSSLRAGAVLSSADIEAMARLMSELRELTQSRATYATASDFLRRFGYEADHGTLVQADQLAN